MIKSKAQLMTDLEIAVKEKNIIKESIIRNHIDAFLDSDLECEVFDDVDGCCTKKASEIPVESIYDEYGNVIAVITADGVERLVKVPKKIKNLVLALKLELIENGISEDRIEEYLMISLLEGRFLK